MDHGEREHRLVVVAELEPVFLAVALRTKLFQFIGKELLADARALIDGYFDAMPISITMPGVEEPAALAGGRC